MVTANPLPFDAFQQSRFFEAVRTDKIEHALDALSKGADINRPEATGGITGLQIGALKGFLAMVRALLEQGADPNMPNGGNNTALTIAIKNRNYMLIEPLLEYGADPNHMAQGANPLHMISSCTPFYKVHDLRREMLARGADPTMPDGKGNTALHYMAYGGGVSPRGIWDCLYAGGDAWDKNEYDCNLFQLADLTDDERIRGVIQRYEKIPHFREADLATLTKKKLFEPNRVNACLLDDPQTWHHFEEVEAALARNGEVLTLEDLKRTVDTNIPALAMAARCHSLAPVCLHLAKQGVRLTPDDLVIGDLGDGQLPPVLRYIEVNRQAPALFDAELWKENGSKAEMQALYAALTEPAQLQVENYHRLSAEIGRQERHVARSVV